jgi:hypothetical protein
MKTLHVGLGLVLGALLFGSSVGCGDDDGGDGSENGGRSGTGGGESGTSGEEDTDAGGGESGSGGEAGEGGEGGEGEAGSGEAGSGGGGDPCPDIADREETLIEGEIDADTTWTCDNLYILTTDLVFVVGDSTLTLEPGTVVQGDPGTALIVTRGSRLVSEGTVDDPIVFTSSSPEGSRSSGDWGGVVMLGSATLNSGEENRVEGIDPTDDRGLYGGTDDSSDCGSLEYTRVEFGGFELSLDNELNGLTLAGCGSDTSVRYVQVHRGSDDGIEIFGGSPTLDHIVLTSNKDDQFDMDEGATPQVQFLVVQQDPAESDTGFEWDNSEDDNTLEPHTMPTVWNATVIGSNDSAGIQNGLVLRRGAWGSLHNFIVMGFPVKAVDVRDAESVAGTEDDSLTIENSLFFENGSDGMSHFPAESGADDNDEGFVEEDFFTDAARNNVFDEDPELGDPYSLTAPDFVPADGSPAADGAGAPPSGFDTSATYMGAFEPGGDDWTADWTAYPED